MDKREAIEIQDAVRDAVDDVMVKHNLIFTKNSARWTPTLIRITLELSVRDAQGVNLAGRADWDLYAEALGLPKDGFGKEFSLRTGKKFVIVGLNPKCWRFPVVAEEVGTGERYKFPVLDVAKALGGQL